MIPYNRDIHITVTVHVTVLLPAPPRWYGLVRFGMECPDPACVSTVKCLDQMARAASATEVM